MPSLPTNRDFGNITIGQGLPVTISRFGLFDQ